MADGIIQHSFVVEFDFADFDDEEYSKHIDSLRNELFEDMSIVLSRLVKKYPSLVGFRQNLDVSTLFNEVKE